MKLHRKSVTKRSGVALFLCAGGTLMGEYKENSVTKAFKILQSVGVALQYLDLVVAALGKSVCIWTEKGIRNGCKPIVICFCTLNERRDLTFQGFLDPIGEEVLLLVWIRFVKY